MPFLFSEVARNLNRSYHKVLHQKVCSISGYRILVLKLFFGCEVGLGWKSDSTHSLSLSMTLSIIVSKEAVQSSGDKVPLRKRGKIDDFKT